MKIFITILKIILSIVFSILIGFILKTFVLDTKEKSLKRAGHSQGSMISQKSFDILTFKYPNFDEAYLGKSFPHNKRGDFAKGFDLLNKAVELKPKSHLGYRAWLRLRKLRDFDNALKDFEEYDLQTPNDVDYPWGENLYYLKGECYFGKQEYQQAIKQFNKAIEIDNNSADIHNYIYLGLCYKELGNTSEAINHLNKALDISELTCEADYYLANIFFDIDKLELAKKYIKQAEKNIDYKREDNYNEFLNEVYLTEILELKRNIYKKKK